MGMGKELRDFVAAFSSGQKMAGASDDREYRKLRNQALKQKMDLDKTKTDAQVKRLGRGPQMRPVDPEVTRGRKLRNDLYERQIKAIDSPAISSPTFSPEPAPSLGKRSAIDLEPEYQTSELEPDEELEPTTFARKGGAITLKGYADGGVVEEDDAPEVEDVDPEELDAEDEYDAGGEDGEAMSPAGYSHLAARDATTAGLAYAKAESEKEPEGASKQAIETTDFSSQNRTSPTRRYLSGHGAAPVVDVMAVQKMLDPEGKMSESQRVMASLSRVYTYYLQRGDRDAADRAAGSLVQNYRAMAGRYESLMKVAAEHGNVDETLKAAARMHSNIPDGRDLKVEKSSGGKINWAITDSETGKTIEGGMMTPDEVLSWASKGTLNSFDQLIEASSKDRTEAAKGAKGKKGEAEMKAADAKNYSGMIDTELPDETPENKTERAETKGIAHQLMGANKGLHAADIVGAVGALTKVDPENRDAIRFKTIGPVEGGTKVELPNGQPLVIPDALLPRIKKQLDASRAAAAKKAGEDKVTAARSKETWDAAGRVLAPAPMADRKKAQDERNARRAWRPRAIEAP